MQDYYISKYEGEQIDHAISVANELETSAVRNTVQSLTDEQKQIARNNIDAPSKKDLDGTKTDLDDYKHEVNQKFDEVNQGITDLTHRVDNKFDELDQTDENLQRDLTETNNKLTQEITDRESADTHFQDQITEHKNASNQKFTELDQKNLDQDTATNKVASDLSTYQTSNDSEIENLKAKDQEIDSTIATLNQKVDHNKSDLTESINELESNFNTHVSANNQKFTELDQKNLDQDTATNKVASDLSTYQTSNDSEIENLKAKDQEIDSTIATLNQKVDHNKSDLEESIRTNRAEVESTISELDQKVDQNKSDLDSTISTLEDKVNQNKSDLTDSIKGLENNFNIHVTANNQKFSEIDSKNSEQDASLGKLYDAVYPIIVSLSVSSEVSAMSSRVSYSFVSDNAPLIPDAVTLTKKVNDANAISLNPTIAASGSTTTPIEGCREIFYIKVDKDNRTSKSASTTRYLVYFGASQINTASVSLLSELTPRITTGVGFNPTITTEDNDYLWLVVPSYLNINRVTSQGFDVLFNSPVTVTNKLGNFKFYRSINQLTTATWSLVIT